MHRTRRPAIVLFVIGVVVGSVAVVGVPAAGAISDDDCDALLSGENWSQSAADSSLDALASTAASMQTTADDISDRGLQKGLRKMASVYKAASKAPNVRAAGIVFSKKANKWAAGYKVYARALNDCQMKELESITDDR